MPLHEKKDLIRQLLRLRQWSKSVEQYYKEMEIVVIKCDLEDNVREK